MIQPMASHELIDLWTKIVAHLARARATLPNEAAASVAIREYQDFVDNNELELACDMLEQYAEEQAVSREFWLALRDAAAEMRLSERASLYEGYAAAE